MSKEDTSADITKENAMRVEEFLKNAMMLPGAYKYKQKEEASMLPQYIEVEKINKYGNDLIYPVCDTAKKFCKLLGKQKTLTMANVEAIKDIGFGVRCCVRGHGGNSFVLGDL